MLASRWIPRALVTLSIAGLTLAMAGTVAASSPPSHAGRVLHASLAGGTAGASCTVAETATPDPGTGHTWGAATYTPSATATIVGASTVDVTVTNLRT